MAGSRGSDAQPDFEYQVDKVTGLCYCSSRTGIPSTDLNTHAILSRTIKWTSDELLDAQSQQWNVPFLHSKIYLPTYLGIYQIPNFQDLFLAVGQAMDHSTFLRGQLQNNLEAGKHWVGR